MVHCWFSLSCLFSTIAFEQIMSPSYRLEVLEQNSVSQVDWLLEKLDSLPLDADPILQHAR